MAFGTYEESTESGRPIQLYRFTLGDPDTVDPGTGMPNGVRWLYTSADDNLDILGMTWKAVAIRDDGIKQSGEANTDALNIECQSDIGPAMVYRSSPPATPIQVDILRLHEGDTTPQIIYVGEILQINFPKPGAATITCQTLMATMRRMGLRLSYTRTCPYTVYDPLTCKVDKSLWAWPVNIQSVSGFNVSSTDLAAKGDGYFTGGFIEWTHPTRGVQRIMIESHVGSLMRLFDDTGEIYPGLQVIAYRGCNQTSERCDSFNNLPNFGGFEFMPGKSPYDGLATPFF
jgi:uncharacterized phage protein (TIGR02218 family)